MERRGNWGCGGMEGMAGGEWWRADWPYAAMPEEGKSLLHLCWCLLCMSGLHANCKANSDCACRLAAHKERGWMLWATTC